MNVHVAGLNIVNLSREIGSQETVNQAYVEELREMIRLYKAGYKEGFWMESLYECGANMQVVCAAEFN